MAARARFHPGGARLGNPFKSLARGLAKTAPALAIGIGGATGGPIGAAIARAGVQRVAGALGLEDTEDPAVVEDALGRASMEDLGRVADADREFERERLRIAARDRANARSREIETGDKTPARLAYLDTATLIAVIVAVFAGAWMGVGGGDMNDMVVGLVSSIVTGVLMMARSSREYFYGSSASADAGAKRKGRNA